MNLHMSVAHAAQRANSTTDSHVSTATSLHQSVLRLHPIRVYSGFTLFRHASPCRPTVRHVRGITWLDIVLRPLSCCCGRCPVAAPPCTHYSSTVHSTAAAVLIQRCGRRNQSCGRSKRSAATTIRTLYRSRNSDTAMQPQFGHTAAATVKKHYCGRSAGGPSSSFRSTAPFTASPTASPDHGDHGVARSQRARPRRGRRARSRAGTSGHA
jgi:hypothetical protein